MNWITLAEILAVWSLVGLTVAYLFGRFVQRMETPEDAGKVASAPVTYLNRTRVSSRAGTAARRAAGGRRR